MELEHTRAKELLQKLEERKFSLESDKKSSGKEISALKKGLLT